MTGASLSLRQWIASGEAKANRPPEPAVPATALNLASGSTSARVSRKGEKLWEKGGSWARMTLFSLTTVRNLLTVRRALAMTLSRTSQSSLYGALYPSRRSTPCR